MKPFINQLTTVLHILTHNVTLTSIDISGVDCGSEDAWEAFGEALKANPQNVLQHINVNDNPFGEKGVIPFTSGLGAITHPMTSIHVSGTSLQCKERGEERGRGRGRETERQRERQRERERERERERAREREVE
jgi:hypothetical protein